MSAMSVSIGLVLAGATSLLSGCATPLILPPYTYHGGRTVVVVCILAKCEVPRTIVQSDDEDACHE